MKNITVFTVLVIIISAFVLNNSAYCQDSDKNDKYGFSVGPQYGFFYGQAFELVYPTNTKGELLSELIWDMKPVYYTGIQLDFGRIDPMTSPGFFSTASFKAGFGGDSGKMEDRDWRSIENDALTNFSSHTNKTRELFLLDIKAGASFPLIDYFWIKPFFSGSWMRFSFSARDGYSIYARVITFDNLGEPITFHPIDDDPKIDPCEGKNVVNYKQNWFIASTGFSIGTKILYPFSFDLSFQISPLTYCAAIDEHPLRDLTFADFSWLGLFIESGGSVSFSAQRIEFSFIFNYRYIGKTRGISYMKKGGGDFSQYPLENEAGAGLSLAETGFMVRVKL